MANRPPKSKVLETKKRQAAVQVQRSPSIARAVITQVVPSSLQASQSHLRHLRTQVARLKAQLERGEYTEEQRQQIRESLGVVTAQLKVEVEKARKKRSLKKQTTVGTVLLSASEAQARAKSIRAKIQQVQAQINQTKSREASSGGKAKQEARKQLIVLKATLAGLYYRLRLLARGRGVVTSQALPRDQMRNHLPPLSLPHLFVAPTREDAATAARLVAVKRPRKATESDTAYRNVLRAYTKRILVRKAGHPQSGVALSTAIQQTMKEDSPAIEEAALHGKVPHDDVGNVADAAIQDASEEIEETVIDSTPCGDAEEVVSKGRAAVEDLLDDAYQEEAILAQEQEKDEVAELFLPSARKPAVNYRGLLIAAGVFVAAALLWRR